MSESSSFKDTFQEVAREIKRRKHMTIDAVGRRLAERISRSVDTINRWNYRGHVPGESDTRLLAMALKEEFGVERNLVSRFLDSARYPLTKALCDELYGLAMTGSVATAPGAVSRNGHDEQPRAQLNREARYTRSIPGLRAMPISKDNLWLSAIEPIPQYIDLAIRTLLEDFNGPEQYEYAAMDFLDAAANSIAQSILPEHLASVVGVATELSYQGDNPTPATRSNGLAESSAAYYLSALRHLPHGRDRRVILKQALRFPERSKDGYELLYALELVHSLDQKVSDRIVTPVISQADHVWYDRITTVANEVKDQVNRRSISTP